MKKVLFVALVALLVLPLMFSCTPQNAPEEEKPEIIYDPEKPEEGIGSESWLEYWTEGEDKDTVPIDINNLIGVWQLRAEGTKIMDSINTDSVIGAIYRYDLALTDEEYFYYYEIKEDLTDTLFMLRNSLFGATAGVSTLEKFPGKWQVTGKTLTINCERFSGIFDNSVTAREFTIYLLEKDRMVWQYNTNSYAVFVRADKPKEPENRKLTDVLTSKKWNITYDQQMTTGFKPSDDPTDASGGTTDTLSIKKNMWNDYQLEFKTDGTDSILTVYDHSGTIAEEYAWHVDGGENLTWLHFKLDPKGTGKLFSTFLSLELLDFKDFNKACMWSWEQAEKQTGYESCNMQRYFEIEGR